MRLPGTNLDVSALSLGTSGLGTDLRGDDVVRLLDAYAEAGGNFLDSAHVYACWVPGGAGASERAVGDWLRRSGARDRTIVSTKGGHPPMDGYPHASDFLRPEALAQDVAESLERLGTDRIDLYYLHRDDGKTPVAEIVDALDELPSLCAFGASNWSVRRVAEANAYARQAGKRGFVTLQNQWSLAVPAWRPTNDPTVRYVTDADHLWCVENDVILHVYSSVANGYFDSDRSDGSFAGNEARRRRVREMAERTGRTRTQIALAWLLSQRGAVVPIVGTTRLDRLRDALGAIELRLDAESLEWLRNV